MNDYIQNCLESGQKCSQWIVDHSAGIPAGSFFRSTCDDLTPCVGTMEDVAGHLAAAGAESHGQTEVKGSNRETVIDVMTRNLNAARSAEPLNPGTEDRYYFRRNLSNENLLAAARSHVEGGNTDEDLLKNYGAPATWIADTQAAARISRPRSTPRPPPPAAASATTPR